MAMDLLKVLQLFFTEYSKDLLGKFYKNRNECVFNADSQYFALGHPFICVFKASFHV